MLLIASAEAAIQASKQAHIIQTLFLCLYRNTVDRFLVSFNTQIGGVAPIAMLHQFKKLLFMTAILISIRDTKKVSERMCSSDKVIALLRSLHQLLSI